MSLSRDSALMTAVVVIQDDGQRGSVVGDLNVLS